MRSVVRAVSLSVLVLIGLLFWAGLFNSAQAAASDAPTACTLRPTPELLDVKPVTSPTALFTQTLYVKLGNGRFITVTSEAGTTMITGTFSGFTWTPITIPLLPSIRHNLAVIGAVEYEPGCFYTLTYDQPLIIDQRVYGVFLPVILHDEAPLMDEAR